MKCWTRYALPWVMAFCLFLGSVFFSLEVDAASGSLSSLDACMSSIISSNSEYPFVVLMDDPLDLGDYIQYTVYLSESEFLYDTQADALYYLDTKTRYYYYCYIRKYDDGSFKVTSVLRQSGVSNPDNRIRLYGKQILASSSDIYYQEIP